MSEMKNPNQPIGATNPRTLFAAALMGFLALFLLQSFKPSSHRNPAIATSTQASQPPANTHKSTLPDRPTPNAQTRFLDLLTHPLFYILNWIHTHIIANWGWAILVLTLLINLLLLPLRIKTMRAQQTTQRLQPEIAAIREKFKGCKFGDPRMQQMQQEISALQRTHGMGILSNFVPMLIQLPLLYSFYRMLHGATQLHQAPWLWLHDLSAADPFHILPILFVSTMILQQLLIPAPGTDPTQRKLMAIVLPLLYFGFTWHTSAGLALYWSFGNIILIVQQIIFNRIAANPPDLGPPTPDDRLTSSPIHPRAKGPTPSQPRAQP